MEFFNRKEEVIEITLTPHGRKLFRDGLFKPCYYAFSDNALLYDERYSGYTGSQNDFSERLDIIPITKKSVYLSTNDNPYFSEKDFLNASIIGSAELGQQKYPAFEVKIHQGHLSGSAQYLTSTFSNTRTPRFAIQMNNVFNTTVKEFEFQEDCVLEINEINGLFERENFEVEIFKVERINLSGIGTVYRYRDLFFTPEVQISEFSPEAIFSSSQVEYWFDVTVDERIAETIDFDTLKRESIYHRPENTQTGTQC